MDDQKLSVKPRNGYGFIYCYTSPSGKKYIGKTKTSLKERAKNNAKGYKGCPVFYNAIQKYGWENFEVEILEEVPLDVIDDAEVEIKLLNPKAPCFIKDDNENYIYLILPVTFSSVN